MCLGNTSKIKKSKHAIKFYELTSHDEYILNLEIYQERDQEQPNPEHNSKTEELVFRLMGPYLNKGHHIYMDNFYNSVSLSSKLLRHKTHSTGTLRTNRRGNPSIVIKKKMRKGEHIWEKKTESVYVSKWKDKREVVAITTGYKPVIVTVRNKYGIEKEKPIEIDAYNRHMSGIDKSDQMLSYYICPRKTIRWYKKVIFRFLDIAMWNSYFLNTKSVRKMQFIEFREAVIRSLLQIEDIEDGRKCVKQNPLKGRTAPSPNQHFLENIPVPQDYKKPNLILKCRECTKNKVRLETRYRCETCQDKRPLCPALCLKLWQQE